MSEAEINRIIGKLEAWKEQQTSQINVLFNKVDDIKADTSSLKAEMQAVRENCVKKHTALDVAATTDKASEVTLLGGKLLSVKNVRLTGRDIVLFLLVTAVILIGVDKLGLLKLFG